MNYIERSIKEAMPKLTDDKVRAVAAYALANNWDIDFSEMSNRRIATEVKLILSEIG
jgi:hypothetical protein